MSPRESSSSRSCRSTTRSSNTGSTKDPARPSAATQFGPPVSPRYIARRASEGNIMSAPRSRVGLVSCGVPLFSGLLRNTRKKTRNPPPIARTSYSDQQTGADRFPCPHSAAKEGSAREWGQWNFPSAAGQENKRFIVSSTKSAKKPHFILRALRVRRGFFLLEARLLSHRRRAGERRKTRRLALTPLRVGR